MQHESRKKTIWRAAVGRVAHGRERPFGGYRVEARPEGFVLDHESDASRRGPVERWIVPWDEIVSLTAFRTDEFARETTWIELGIRGQAALGFPDEAQGWSSVAAALPRHLPGFRGLQDGPDEGARPALERRLHVLFER